MPRSARHQIAVLRFCRFRLPTGYFGRRRPDCSTVLGGQVFCDHAAEEDRRDHGAQGGSVDVGELGPDGVALHAEAEVLGDQRTVMA
jgi:hypothetical protein